MIQTNNEKQNTDSADSNKIITEANQGRRTHAYSCNTHFISASFGV